MSKGRLEIGCLAVMRCHMYLDNAIRDTIGDLVLVKSLRGTRASVIHPQHGSIDMDRAFLKFVSSAEAQ